jgi:phosphomethylpyrimidine synthase
MTQLQEALKGEITPLMRAVAAREDLDPEFIRDGIAGGTIAVPKNINHDYRVDCGIGAGLSTKINANIGTSGDCCSLDVELEKLEVCRKYGADTVMDLSTAGDLRAIRKRVIADAGMPVGTVPIYQIMVELAEEKKVFKAMDPERLFEIIEQHGEDGVDFITVHCGVTINVIEKLQRQKRLMDIVSRGGAFLAQWIMANNRENPLYEQYDRLIEIALKYDMTLSLGDGLRPGCLADATDNSQIEELVTLGELSKRAQEAGVQVIVEGPGHVPLNDIVENIRMQKELCNSAPFYVLGPLVTDIAPGYDHITAAIGGAIAAAAGADYLCYVTPAEHLRLPTVDDVREGVIASKIAAHAADIAKGVKGARERDDQMARYRKARDWKKQIDCALDPYRAAELHEAGKSMSDDVCSMCGRFCSMKMLDKKLSQETR